jgi:hypothetical protein
MKHDPIKTAICHHASSLLQKIIGLLPTGRFLIPFQTLIIQPDGKAKGNA